MRTAKLKEWVGRTPEAMPGQTVLLRLYAKQEGVCACPDECGIVMSFERDEIDCDHRVPLIDGGENVEANLQLILRKHHRAKTAGEATARSEERRHKAKAFTALRQPTMRGAGFHPREPQRSATRKVDKWSLLS
ncbi:HNH endonuclease signature motif containing protein [Devosia sp. A369]